MIAIVHSIYSQSGHALALNAGSMDNDAGRYCMCVQIKFLTSDFWMHYFTIHYNTSQYITINYNTLQ